MAKEGATPGTRVVYPNRDKASSKLIKWLVVVVLLISIVLMLAVSLGAWSKLQGMKPVDFLWELIYLILAIYVGFKWSRGAVTMAMGLGTLLLIIALVAGLGATGTSWFQRSDAGYGAAQSVFGSSGFSADTIGFLTVLIAPVQAVLIVLCAIAMSQGWNVETEVSDRDGRDDGGGRDDGSDEQDARPRPSGPVTAQRLPA